MLIGAIVVLSFMLLTEWVAFQEEKTTVAVQETARLINQDDFSTQLPDASDASLPVVENGVGNGVEQGARQVVDQGTAAEEDLPSAPVEEPSATPVPSISEISEQGNSNPIILVTTDVFKLAIDLRGGDIVELALPKFLAKQDNPNDPFVLLEKNDQLVYVAQSGLIGADGIDKGGRALFSTNANSYKLSENETNLIVDLHWTENSNVKVTKRFTFTRSDYLINVEYIVENNGTSRWQGNLFGQIKRDSRPPPSSETAAMGMQPFLGVALTQPDDRFTKLDFDDVADEPFKGKLPGGWIAMIQHYFLSAWIPNDQQSHSYSARATSSGHNIAGFTSPALVLDPGKSGSVGAQFYAGPKDQYRLKEISPYLELSVDYGWLWWIAQPLFWLLTKIFSFVGNWGVAIILLTVLIKAAFFKLSAASYRSMANMRRVQPQLVDLREQYADDKQKQSQAMMELYKKEKINPMGGCLPILVQMPVFIGLYWMLMESVELRHAPFALWIEDLSVMDPYFVLPLMMGASMFFMQRLNPPPPDPMQAKIMQWMPIMFTFFFLWFPAGLVLYWVVNNLLSMAQQYVITRQIEKAAA